MKVPQKEENFFKGAIAVVKNQNSAFSKTDKLQVLKLETLTRYGATIPCERHFYNKTSTGPGKTVSQVRSKREDLSWISRTPGKKAKCSDTHF